MAKRRYRVTGTFMAYDTEPGGVVTLEEGDEAVQVNVSAGVLELDAEASEEAEPKVPCPACEEQGVKRPPKFESQDELAKHYGDKHPGLVVPDVREE